MEVAAGQTLVAGQVEPQQPQHSVEPRVDGLLLRKLQAGGQQRRLGVPRHPKPEAWRPLVLRAAWPRSLGQAEEAPQQFLVLAEAAEQFAGERAAARSDRAGPARRDSVEVGPVLGFAPPGFGSAPSGSRQMRCSELEERSGSELGCEHLVGAEQG
jgi:hypothetical protein